MLVTELAVTMMVKSHKNFDVAVIGGGIGGLALTIGLIHQGVPVHLYEAAPAFTEIGAGVSFGPNALRAMALIDPAIKRGYDRLATRNAWPEKRKIWFDFRWGMDQRNCGDSRGSKAGDWVCGIEAGEIGQNSGHRAHFLDELVALIPEGTASFGKKLEEIEETDDGVRILFADGTSSAASAAIGCDGVKSRMRQILLGDDALGPVFTGKYAYRGLVPMDEARKHLGDEMARNSQLHMGYDGHLLTFPIEGGKTMNVVAFQTKENGRWEYDQWVLPMKRDDMFRDFSGWGKNVQHILSLMQRPDVWALFDHPPAKTYHRAGKICMLGDSAHASTPHQGAGAGMALEDAYILSNLLGCITDASGIESAFYAYDAVRRPRTQKLVTTSREAAAVYEFQNENTRDDSRKIKENLHQRYKWIWEEDLEKQLSVAKRALQAKARI